MKRLNAWLATETETMPWWGYVWGGYLGGLIWFGLMALIWWLTGSWCPTDCDAWIAARWGIP